MDKDKTDHCPLLLHTPDTPSAFRPEGLVAAVRRTRHLPELPVPDICVLDFDGDLTDWLVDQGIATPFAPWACFHTTMYEAEVDGIRFGIVARTIGGPYSVLIAEQLRVSGAKLVLGLTSAGRVATTLPLPSLVVATSAIRDEGTSFHYIADGETVVCPTRVDVALLAEFRRLPLPAFAGPVWTTDAPYRETQDELDRYAAEGVLAVEMQAASLFAFGQALGVEVGVVAHVTNAVGPNAEHGPEHGTEQFDKGSDADSFSILGAMLRASRSHLEGRNGT